MNPYTNLETLHSIAKEREAERLHAARVAAMLENTPPESAARPPRRGRLAQARWRSSLAAGIERLVLVWRTARVA